MNFDPPPLNDPDARCSERDAYDALKTFAAALLPAFTTWRDGLGIAPGGVLVGSAFTSWLQAQRTAGNVSADNCRLAYERVKAVRQAGFGFSRPEQYARMQNGRA